MDQYINEPPGMLEYVPRESWGAEAASPQTDGLRVLNVPVEHVVTTWTETDACLTRQDCVSRIKAIQAEHIARGLPDIEYNFLVGSDGYLYEGRGFRYEGPEYPATSKTAKELAGKSIEVAFIDKSSNDASDGISRALGTLISLGIEIEALKQKIHFFSRTNTYFSFIHTYNTNDEKSVTEKEEESKKNTIKRRQTKQPTDKSTY